MGLCVEALDPRKYVQLHYVRREDGTMEFVIVNRDGQIIVCDNNPFMFPGAVVKRVMYLPDDGKKQLKKMRGRGEWSRRCTRSR